jgi:hypothetical protein
MKRLAIALLLCTVLAGAALAVEPQVTFGPAGDPTELPLRQDACQYGFSDDITGQGWSLYSGQQLGIRCPDAGCITAVGFYVEFISIDGSFDIVIYDDNGEVSRTTLPAGSIAVGVNEFDITDVNITGTACIMLCPTTWDGVTGEDYTSPPYGESYWSTNCTCQNPFSDNNLTIWAVLCGATATEQVSWGSIRTLYR